MFNLVAIMGDDNTSLSFKEAYLFSLGLTALNQRFKQRNDGSPHQITEYPNLSIFLFKYISNKVLVYTMIRQVQTLIA